MSVTLPSQNAPSGAHGERQRADATDRRYAGQLGERTHEILVATRGGRGDRGIARPRLRHLHADRTFRVEAGIDRKQPDETASEQARADQQYRRQRGLSDEESAARAQVTARR